MDPININCSSVIRISCCYIPIWNVLRQIFPKKLVSFSMWIDHTRWARNTWAMAAIFILTIADVMDMVSPFLAVDKNCKKPNQCWNFSLFWESSISNINFSQLCVFLFVIHRKTKNIKWDWKWCKIWMWLLCVITDRFRNLSDILISYIVFLHCLAELSVSSPRLRQPHRASLILPVLVRPWRLPWQP